MFLGIIATVILVISIVNFLFLFVEWFILQNILLVLKIQLRKEKKNERSTTDNTN